VQLRKEVPRVSFPFIVYGVRRARAAMSQARCPGAAPSSAGSERAADPSEVRCGTMEA